MDIDKLIDSSRFKNKSEIKNTILNLKDQFQNELFKLIKFASLSPDPDLSLRTLTKIAPHIDTQILKNAKELLWILGASEYLGKILVKFPELLNLFKSRQHAKPKNTSEFVEELISICKGEKNIENFMSILRKYRDKEYFRIGMLDLLRKANLKQVTHELSSLASAILEISLRFSDCYLRNEEINLEKECTGFVVIGMGKLGGDELNFLSDIDLIYISQDSDSNVYFTRLANNLTKIVGEVTSDGFAFRIDLRLRPDGESGPVVVSLSSALDYYTQWGETWERSALIKATPVAGDLKLGEEFVKGIEPFVYRKYLDYTTIEELKALKEKIEFEMQKKLVNNWNIKTGSGGIRSIEFFVQTLQLINGGKSKKIRKTNTLEAIKSLADEKFITEEAAQGLSSAYTFLRELEHRVQLGEGRRTHLLPDGEELIQVIKRFGNRWEDRELLNKFHNDLNRHRNFVRNIFSSLFYKEEKVTPSSPILEILLDEEADRTSVINNLKNTGFADPEKAFEILKELKEEPAKKRFSSRAKKIFEKLLPLMIEEVSKSSDPDSALHFLSAFLNKVGGKIVPYYQLAENLETMRYLVSIFSNSEFLSNFMINHPELLDYLILRTYAAPIKDRDTMSNELDSSLSESSDYETTMDILRRFRNTEILRIASNDLYGIIDIHEVSEQFTALAEIMLDRCLKIAMDYLSEKYGSPGESKIAILGLGKLGGRELGYNSDLDIIFVYSRDGYSEGGKRTITLREYFTYLAQRVISLLSTYTSEGYIFKVDTRLRPSGNAGAMVTSGESLIKYHMESAWLWERQAMIKTRFVAGDKDFGEKIVGEIKSLIFEKGLGKEEKNEMNRMKERITEEHIKDKNRYNLKYSPGGLVELEFLVQGYQLEHGSTIAELRTPKTRDAINTLIAKNIIEEKDGETLLNAHYFLRKLENRLRLLYDYTTDNLPVDRRELEKLTKSMGRKENLEEIFLYWTKKVNLLYNKYFEII